MDEVDLQFITKFVSEEYFGNPPFLQKIIVKKFRKVLYRQLSIQADCKL